MPTVELLRPRSLTTRGFLFRQNEPRTDVPSEVALELMEDSRFKVAGLSKADFEAISDKPRGRGELHAAIHDAIGQLDVDSEDDFTSSGKPHHLAISRVLGYDITAAERDAAMRASTAGTLDTAEGGSESIDPAKDGSKTKGAGVRIVRGATARQERKEAQLKKLNTVGAQKPEEQDKEPERPEEAGSQQDETTEEAVEV
ncbi:MAG: hypothetical protein M9945_14165 [Aquamicrobium sp.]|uniref:hypothetical protein n=1 Tax=Aquamicrobium sp. TaxID=1872579 RepID=UPI00349E72AC|nr:hypothetical protein [Aquamicrobium sp.]